MTTILDAGKAPTLGLILTPAEIAQSPALIYSWDIAVDRYCPECRTITLQAYRVGYTLCVQCDATIALNGPAHADN